MKVVTVATHDERYFPVLVQSCKRHNIDLVVLGWGKRWQGFTWKFQLVLEYLRKLDPNELVVFIDAYDVIILQDANVIESRFKNIQSQTNAKMIIGWERAKSNLIEGLSHMIFGTCKGKRLNSGTYIGYCKDLLHILQNACTIFKCNQMVENDDQVLFTSFCNMHPDDILVDENFDMFYVINGALKHLNMQQDGIVVYNKTMYVNGTQSPCFIHAIGATNMDEIIHKLGYTNPNPITMKETIRYDIRSVMHFSKYLKVLVLFIAIFCLILAVCAYFDQVGR